VEQGVLAVLGTLGGAAIGVLGTLGVWWLQSRAASRAAEDERRERAYVDLLIASTGVAARAHTLLIMLRMRSGIKEGLAVMFGQQRPLDAQELHDWIEVDVRALMDAWARAWVTGKARGIELANDLVDRCQSLLAVVGSGTAQGALAQVRQTVAGVNTDEMEAAYQSRLRDWAAARRDLAEYVRVETGRVPAALFTSALDVPESADTPDHSAVQQTGN
jgi:hypothetical protein